MKKLFSSLTRHPLIDFLKNLKGNPAISIYIEPLWGIPFNLIAPFATLYMFALGLRDMEIGLILSISMVVQVFFSFGGGIISDKLGRKATTILGDLLGWSLACFVWAISQNFWFFLVAVLLNSFEQVNQTAWHCLLIEDAEQKDLVNIYVWCTIAGLLSVFFAPVSGVLIDRFSLVPVVRVLYMFFCVNMLIKCYITWKYISETKRGKIRMEATKGVPLSTMLYEYKALMPQILKNKKTLGALAVSIVAMITGMINTNFFGLYVHISLGVAEKYLAFFPILRSVVMIIFIFGIQHLIDRFGIKIPMLAGLMLYVLCQTLLIFTPSGCIPLVVVYILLEAVANSLVYPRKESLCAISVDPKERARIMALMLTFSIIVSSPFGYIAGFLSSVDRRLPFALSILLFILAMLVMSRFKEESSDAQPELA